MPVPGFCYRWIAGLAAGAGVCVVQSAFGATPQITLAASNVSIPGQGTATSQFTVKSVNGFAGQVGVGCSGPEQILAPDLVLPQCAGPLVNVSVPANGSATGSINFYPPWSASAAPDSRRAGGGRRSPLPMLASLFAAVGLLALWRRNRSSRVLSVLPAIAGLVLAAGVSACVGQGGLAMTPGTYTYTLDAGNAATSATTTISVTVQCNSCS